MTDQKYEGREPARSEDTQAGETGGMTVMQRAIQRRVQQRALQRKEGGLVQAGPDGGPASAPLGPTGGGAPLPAGVQQKMEGAFGQDFSDVRVHQDGNAQKVGAEAYAQGSNIHFAPGKYDPNSAGGQALLGHELTHVVQQRQGRVQTSAAQAINDDPALEAEADAMGAAAAHDEPAHVGGGAGGAKGGAVQLKAARGSGWGAISWQPGGKEAWDTIVAGYDTFTAEVAKVKALVVTHGPLEADHKETYATLTAAMKWDTTPIPYAEGLTLAAELTALTASARTLVTEIPERHAAALVSEKGALDKLQAALASAGNKQAVITSHHKEWDKANTKERGKLRDSVKALLTANTASKLAPTGKLAELQVDVKAIVKTFDAAEKIARVNQQKANDKKREDKEKEDEAQQGAEALAERETRIVGSMGVAYGKTGKSLLAAMKHRATLDEIEQLLRLTDAGTINALLPLAAPAELVTLLGKTTDAHLKRLIPAIGANETQTLEELIDHVKRGSEDVLLELIQLSTDASELLELVQSFTADKAGAQEALKLLKAGKAGSQGKLALMLQHAGVAAAPQLLSCLGKADAKTVEYALDPATGGHTIHELVADLTPGHKVYGGATGATPAYQKVSAADPTKMAAAAHGDVIANAHDTQALGMPAPNTGKYCSRRFGNNGGADTMRLPRRAGGAALTYTEYDIRPFTSAADRGVIRIVIDNRGTVYYTTDHYASFTRV